MPRLTFREHTIDPASYVDPDMPGYWHPSAEVITPSGRSATVNLLPVRGTTKELADAEAVKVAKIRIANNNL